MRKVFGKSTIVHLLVAVFVVNAVILIPFKVLDWGFMPHDDVLRHAAKVVSGKDWNQVLLLRSEIKMDSHPGWHVLLGAAYKAFGYDAYKLVVFSISSLFILFSLVPLFLLKRPEAWAIALSIVVLVDPIKIFRLLLGRPYLVTSAVVIAICLLWQRLLEKDKSRFKVATLLAGMIALATWIHGSWYIFGIPIVAFFLARQWRAGFLLSVATILGIGIGMVLTGHPRMFLMQTIQHGLLAFSNYRHPSFLVIEFQSFSGDSLLGFVFVFMLMWRALRREWNRAVIDNPVVMIIAITWVSGFLMRRAWVDTGMAAFLSWLAMEFEDILSQRMPLISWKRVLFAGVISCVLFLVATNDYGKRWSSFRPRSFLTFDTPEKASWAPGPGGIVYNTDMTTFFSMFYKNPHAPWRYVLGFEPGIMPADDLATFRDTQESFSPPSFAPWVKKMRPQDRLIIADEKQRVANKIKELEWLDAGNDLWIGRLPRGEAGKTGH